MVADIRSALAPFAVQGAEIPETMEWTAIIARRPGANPSP